MSRATLAFAAAALAVVTGAAAQQPAVDAAAAEALAKKSGCLGCHSVTQQKMGPSYKAVAEKYKGKPDADKALMAHLTTPKVKLPGTEIVHPALKASEAEVRNVVAWILSR